MKKKVLVIASFLIALFSGCKEDEGPNQSSFMESPRFYVNSTINGLPLNLVAGEEGYQMFTSYELEDSVLVMNGVLAADSPAFQKAVVLKIRGSELLGPNSQISAGNVFQQGPLPLMDPSGATVQPGYYDYHFFADSINSHINLLWSAPRSSYYGDSCSIIGLNSSLNQSFTIEMSSAGPLSCTPSVKHTIQTGKECKAQIHVINSTSSELHVEVQERIGRIQEVNWQIAGQNAGQGNSLLYSVVGFQPGYRVKAEVKFESGCTEIIEKIILPGGPSCDINIDYRMEGHRVANPHNLATIELQYYDESGKLFSSAYPNAQGSFVIESVSAYSDANSSLSHQRFSFSGEAVLKSADGSSLQFNNIFGSFALAHP
ncbi:MAG: hypothetical protein ACPGVV_03435 [Croceimicrobium sp.]